MMNKIELVDNQIINKQLESSIQLQVLEDNKFLDVTCIKITVLKDCHLNMKFQNCSHSWKVLLNVHPNVSFQFTEMQLNSTGKIQYQYMIEEDSHVVIEKIHDVKEMKESDIIYLNGKGAKVEQYLKTVSTCPQSYDMMIYHQAPCTNSLICNHGVAIENGGLTFNVSSFVPNGQISCEVDQKNRIVNLTSNTCNIYPNLFIDENDVIANHSAYIGAFGDEELFYLQSRGIPYEEAIQLLIQGFLLKGIVHEESKDCMMDILKQYWR